MSWAGFPRTLLDGALTFPPRRPRTTLAAALALTVLAVFAVSRIRPDASLESMFSRNDPAAAALVHVLNHYSAAEELLVLVTVPDEAADASASAARLLEFAGRFEAELSATPHAAAMADGVAYRADPQFRQFVEKVLVPAGLFYLDDGSFQAARQRLTKDEMRAQVARNASAIAQPGPAAAAMAKVLLQDPLRLHEFLMERLAAGRGTFKTWQGGDAFVSPDGHALLIRVAGKRPPSDLEFAKRFTAAVTSVVQAANSDGLNLAFSGSYAIAATSERAIRRDMTLNIVSAVACLVGLFVVASRRPLRAFALAFAPVALGVMLGFGAYAGFNATLTPLTGAVGAILAGLGIDYSLHYLSHYQGRRRTGAPAPRAAEETAVHLGPPLFAAWLTSVIGFLAVGGSRVAALRDFALLGALGLAGSFLAVVFVLPALLALLDRNQPASNRVAGPRVSFEPLARWVGRRGAIFLGVSVLVLLACVAVMFARGGELLPLESDLTVMHPRPNPALDAQAEIARRFGSSPESMIVHLKADSPDALMALSHRVRERLARDEARQGGVAGTFGLATLLPDPQLVPARLAAVAPGEADRVAADFRAVIADSPFDPDAYEPYAGFLQTLLSRRDAPGLAALSAYPQLVRTVLPAALTTPGPAEAITMVFLTSPAGDRASRDAAVDAARAALADLQGATLTGMSVLSHDVEAEVRRELPRLFALAAGLVAGYLLLHFRSIADALLSTLPTLFSFVVLLAVMRLGGQKLNLMNLVALPLLIGIDVDYGIFLVSIARSAGAYHDGVHQRIVSDLGTGCYAILMCDATTVLGFGSLVTTSVPAVRSLGVVVGVGVLGCLYATLFVLAPLLMLRATRGERRGAARPVGGAAPAPAPVP